MSYPLFAICDDRGYVAENLGQPCITSVASYWIPIAAEMWATFGRIARKRILFVADNYRLTHWPVKSQSRRRHDEEQLFAT
jgi:hypothetical protein